MGTLRSLIYCCITILRRRPCFSVVDQQDAMVYLIFSIEGDRYSTRSRRSSLRLVRVPLDRHIVQHVCCAFDYC